MTTKTCATCKWCVEPGEFAMCHAPQNGKATVTGFGDRWRWIFCDTLREDGWYWSWVLKTCGRRGRWWQPKEAT